MAGRIILPILFILFLAAVFYYGCRGDSKVLDSDETFKRITTQNRTDFAGCYTLILEGDTATMNLQTQGNGYAGDLVYRKLQKNGKITSTPGRIFLYSEGIYLVGYHLIYSQGVNYKEMRFLKEGHNLVEGYGATELRNDTLAFKFPSNLEFDLSNPFKSVECP